MKYGQSQRYTEERGEEYFAYQNQWGALSGKLNAWKFQPYLNAEDRVLDFGCGGGWLLSELEATKKFGIELNPVARSCCEILGIKAFPSIEDLPKDIQFDVIISHHAIEHVPYPIEALRELRGKLKAGGRLVVVLPIDDWRNQRDYSAKDIDHHLHTWSPRLFANTLFEAGFRAEKISILTHAWPPGTEKLSRLPRPLFDALCILWSLLRRRRQLHAIATLLPITAA